MNPQEQQEENQKKAMELQYWKVGVDLKMESCNLATKTGIKHENTEAFLKNAERIYEFITKDKPTLGKSGIFTFGK